jgi:nicotinate-nucleotide pyrophosphorylase (carboxylating)
MEVWLKDGQMVKPGDQAFEIQTSVHNILKAERLVLNIMQRMSGIASLTRKYVDQIADLPSKLLDTRKTTPNFRWFEKRAVLIGGGFNHRMGLYDMIMLKDNHIDYCGGIEQAILKTNQYLKDKNLSLQIEIEARTLEDVKTILEVGQVHRIMLDNFSVSLLKEAVEIIGGQYETEASGGITIESIRSYAETGVDFISAGAIIHHAVSMDLSLKAIKNQG